MRLLRRRPASATLPSRLALLMPGHERVLGAVPLDEGGRRWAVATAQRLVIVDDDGIGASHGWDGVTHGAWDAQERAFTLELLHEDEPLVLTVPERIAGAGRGEAPVVDERAFAVALRQRVNAAVVHHATGTLPSGRRATASVRRRADGSLYSITDPPRAGGDSGGRELDPDDVEALLALERRVRDGVGLPTP